LSGFRVEIQATIPALRRYARALTHDREVAEDLVQDTYLKAFRAADRFELTREAVDRDGQKPAQRVERTPIAASVEKNSEESRQCQAAALGRFNESRNALDLVVAHDLRQEKLRVKGRGGHVIHLPVGIGMRICPSSQMDGRIALSQHVPQLPGMLNRARSAHGPVAAEHNQGGMMFSFNVARDRELAR